MEKRILQIIEMQQSGICKQLFLDLILNCTNGEAGRYLSSYANRLKLSEWIELFGKPFTDINVSEALDVLT